MNEDRIFVDTNVLVFGHDVDTGQTHEIAQGLLFDFWNNGPKSLRSQPLLWMTQMISKLSCALFVSQITALNFGLGKG
jgi:hypothetical protein